MVAPATARLLAAYAAGLSDDLLTATLLATRAPVVVCPAMHTEMWEHPAVQANLDTLRARGVTVVPPGEGRLAGGDVGTGRLADPADIVAAVEGVLGGADAPGATSPGCGSWSPPAAPARPSTRCGSSPTAPRASRATPSPPRHSTAAPGSPSSPPSTGRRPPGAEVVEVVSAADMEAAVVPRAADHDVVVMAAAVADFRPAAVADHKIKKDELGADGPPRLVLEPTHDFLVDLGRAKRPGQVAGRLRRRDRRRRGQRPRTSSSASTST